MKRFLHFAHHRASASHVRLHAVGAIGASTGAGAVASCEAWLALVGRAGRKPVDEVAQLLQGSVPV